MTFRNSTRAIAAGTLLAAMLGTANIAQAATPVTFTLDSTIAGEAAYPTIAGYSPYGGAGCEAGIFSGSLTNTVTNSKVSGIAMYCVDFTNDINFGDNVTGSSLVTGFSSFGSPSNPLNHAGVYTTTQNAEAAAWLIANNSGSGISTTTAANVQIALWDVIAAGGDTSSSALNVTNTSGVTNASVTALVNSAYTAILANSALTNSSLLGSVDWIQTPGDKTATGYGTQYQDFAFYNGQGNFTGTPNFTATPEPGSVAMLMGMGATGIGFLRRRRSLRATK